MTAESFTTWLSGFFEMANPASLDKEQTQKIREKLNLVKRITPLPTPSAPIPITPLIPFDDKSWPDQWDKKRYPRGLEIRD